MAHRTTATKSKRPARTAAKSASRKTKSSARKPGSGSAVRRAGDEQVTIDRRRSDRRAEQSAASAATAAAPPLERRKKVNRRRQIDPTTCERDYTNDEIEFMNALDEYKRTSGRMFPTCSEVLEVVRSLGYVRLSPSEMAAARENQPTEPSAEPETQVEAVAIAAAGEWQ